LKKGIEQQLIQSNSRTFLFLPSHSPLDVLVSHSVKMEQSNCQFDNLTIWVIKVTNISEDINA